MKTYEEFYEELYHALTEDAYFEMLIEIEEAYLRDELTAEEHYHLTQGIDFDQYLED